MEKDDRHCANVRSLTQARLADISDEAVLKLLEEGETYANQVANEKLHAVQKVVGLK